MKKCEVLKTITITVQAGSQVIISDRQYDAVNALSRDMLKIVPENEMVLEEVVTEEDTPEEVTSEEVAPDVKPYKDMTKVELTALAKERALDVNESMTKAQLINLLEG